MPVLGSNIQVEKANKKKSAKKLVGTLSVKPRASYFCVPFLMFAPSLLTERLEEAWLRTSLNLKRWSLEPRINYRYFPSRSPKALHIFSLGPWSLKPPLPPLKFVFGFQRLFSFHKVTQALTRSGFE